MKYSETKTNRKFTTIGARSKTRKKCRKRNRETVIYTKKRKERSNRGGDREERKEVRKRGVQGRLQLKTLFPLSVDILVCLRSREATAVESVAKSLCVCV